MIALLLLYFILVCVPILGNDNLLSRYSLIVFGSKTCPYCRALHDFFDRNYKDKYYFFWIEDGSGANLLSRLVMIEVYHGVRENFARAVPQTLVLVNGSPVAIVIGGITSAEFWNRLVSSSTTDVVTVYFEEERSGAEIPVDSLTSFLSDLEKDLEKTLTQPPQRNIDFMGLGLIFVGVAVLALYFLMRRRSLQAR